MTSPAIRVEQLGKRYRLGENERYHMLRDSFAQLLVRARATVTGRRHAAPRAAEPDRAFWALRDVSFEIPLGAVVGIVGRNGAGKSTLLKILSRITEPSAGRVEIRGRIGSLLEVGTGFHPELTGRENVYVNGSILGMSRAEIRRKFDEIVAFAGVERFLDTPVKRYSSGMQVRLAFAVAAHLAPDILVVDEVLAVGDAAFQSKCLGRMEEIAQAGRTVLLVSHNMAVVESLCDTALLLEAGRLAMLADVPAVIERYLGDSGGPQLDVDLAAHPARTPGCTPVLRRLRVTDAHRSLLGHLSLGHDATFEIHLAAEAPVPELDVTVRIFGLRGERILVCHTAYQHPGRLQLDRELIVRCTLKNCRLTPGLYRVSLGVLSQGVRLDQIQSAATLEVIGRDIYGTGKLPPPNSGFMVPEVEWGVEGGEVGW